jgi:uncharacterized protein
MEKDKFYFKDNNLHWSGSYQSQFNFKREAFKKLLDLNKTKLMTFIIGPRRMGKTVLLTQVIDHLINKQKTNPLQILSWECRQNQTNEFLEEMIKEYLNTIANRKHRVYIILDEIQFIHDWENVIKFIYDLDSDIKFIITGSVSISYKRRMEESLAGRYLPLDVYPLNFKEYLQLTKNKALLKAIESEVIEKYSTPDDELNKEFIKFLQFGRYPGAIELEKENLSYYIRSILYQSLNLDAMYYFNVEKPNILNDIFDYLRLNNGSEVIHSTLSQIVGVSVTTIIKYIDVLELLGLIYILNNSNNPLKRNTSSKKIYVTSSFDNAYSPTNPDKIGQMVESYIYERISIKNYGRFGRIGYYRERNNEIDFINYDQKVGLEVKFRNKIDSKDVLKFEELCNKIKVKPFLITKGFLPFKSAIEYQLACLL